MGAFDDLVPAGKPAAGGAAPSGVKLKPNWAMGADGVARPVSGTPDAQKAIDGAAARNSDLRKMANLVRDARGLQQRATGLSDMFEGYQPTTGLLGKLLSGVPGTAAYNFNKSLDTVRANVGFDELAKMRAQSPTGAALGSISDSENKLLQSTLASIDPGQSVDAVKGSLSRIEKEYAARYLARGGSPAGIAVRPPTMAPGKPAAKPAAKPAGKRLRFNPATGELE